MKNISSSYANYCLLQTQRAYEAFLELQITKGITRSRGIEAMANALQNAFAEILEANTIDLEISKEMAVPELILEWLKLTPERLQNTIEILKQLANLSDPIEKVINAPYQLETCQTYCQRMPLGVITFIYEAFPELAAIAAGLCLKTGNSLILRGSGEASHVNTVIYQALKTALEEASLPPGSIEFISSENGISIQDLLNQDSHINLVIPYGRPSLIQQVAQLARVPVLKSAMGNCCLYWSPSGDLDLARSVILDSHDSQPDPVNAIEKVLINSSHKPASLLRLLRSLEEKGFTLQGDDSLVAEFPEQLQLVKSSEWKQPYLNKTIAFRAVDNIESAIAWINRYSSGHADCLVTSSYQESRQFALGVDSALVYINSSPRFTRNPKGEDAIFLGISNQKGNRRGLISLETFTTVKQIIQGNC